jgi:uncharacterized protein
LERTIGRSTPRAGLGAALFALAALAFAAFGAEVAVPKLTAHVIDQTGTLTGDERARLDAKLAEFETRRGSQVVVLIVPSIGGEAIEDFSTRVTDDWKLGRKGVDDGVLFVIAKQERKMRIHTGRGVQGTLTDILAKRIVADIVAPKFRTGDFAGGIDEASDAIMKAIEGENLALPTPKSKPQGRKVDTVSSYGDFLWMAFFLVPVIAMVLRGLVGRFAGAGLTGGVTGLAAAWIFGSIVFGVFAALIAFVAGLTMGAGSRGGGGWGGSWGGGGWSGGGGGGGWSGGGGMSGGGGGFDGGGASGDW